jgi:hypothetical protein
MFRTYKPEHSSPLNNEAEYNLHKNARTTHKTITIILTQNKPSLQTTSSTNEQDDYLLIPITGRPLQGHWSVIANKEIVIRNRTYIIFYHHKRARQIRLLFSCENASERINSTTETPRKYIPPSAFEHSPKNRFLDLLCALSSTWRQVRDFRSFVVRSLQTAVKTAAKYWWPICDYKPTPVLTLGIKSQRHIYIRYNGLTSRNHKLRTARFAVLMKIIIKRTIA